jgi:hypothetical protein
VVAIRQKGSCRQGQGYRGQQVLGGVLYLCFFLSALQKFIAGYPNLFGGADLDEGEEGDADEFTTYFGFLFNNKLISEFYAISIPQVFDMPVTEALNALSYLKAKAIYDKAHSGKKPEEY